MARAGHTSGRAAMRHARGGRRGGQPGRGAAKGSRRPAWQGTGATGYGYEGGGGRNPDATSEGARHPIRT